MAHTDKIATVFGGTGFLGKQIVQRLADHGITVKVASRVPEHVYALKTYGAVGQIVGVKCDYSNASSIQDAVRGSDYVINCVGILFERGRRAQFQRAHADVPDMIAQACKAEGVSRFVHISALGCDQSSSKYAKSKLAGENAIHENFPSATILRPSVIFGPGDGFFSKFGELTRFLPFVPLIGGGKTKFQPIYVGDVAEIVMKVVLSTKGEYRSKTYQLGGPEILTIKEMFEKLFEYTGRPRRFVKLPFWLAKFEAFFLGLLPNPLLTPDQVESLKTDNVVSEGALDLKFFGLQPKSMDLVLPGYLEMYRSGGRFSDKQAA